MRYSSLIGLAWCVFAGAAGAQTSTTSATAVDTVILAPKADGAGRIVVTGRVVDYTGAALVLDASGQKQTIPGKQVVEVRSTWTAEQSAGDDLWRRRDYAAAQAKYAAALSTEIRPWVQRLVRSKLVAVLREQDRWELAADEFLRLVTDDPQTPYFAVIPLPWTATAPSPALEAKARSWTVAGNSTNAAALLGASFLLSSADRASALKRLRELALDGDPRIAILAEAQLWRNAAVTADASMVEGWERTVDKLPEPLRAGPALIVGRAWAQRGEPERSALLLLRVPILHDDQHRLAAEALWSGGQMLERMSQSAEAATLYRELVRDFPKSQVAGPAGERIKELAAKP